MSRHDTKLRSVRENPPLDRWRFDAITTGPEKLWGLSTIASAIGVSVDKARRLAHLDHVPIYRPDGESYFALRSELNAWLRTKR
ncbi:hypothetical protein ROJ8625_00713 [Roseivivax jejudonensis]|uniref:Helix-turn-helix domain protein n=1 Tax=Roseivivax jejudonensis TaxID=1529041 RepID=A0A1X6YFP3_9RHOB|nr:DNA-binding protein [Roseivivax jejudonensis]SLN20081.1 hypothetical protein ROJ8625_00713 [Roseivivax jejudonensis]